MGRVLVSLPVDDEAGPRIGGSGTEVRIYQDKALTTLSTIYAEETGGGTLPNPSIPNAGFQTDLTVVTAAPDTVITVRDVSGFAVGNLVPVYDGTTTTYRAITAINAGAKQLTLSAAIGSIYTVGPTLVGNPDMVGHLHAWVDDPVNHFFQVKDVASTRVLPPFSIPSKAPATTISVLEEGVSTGTARPIVNYVGRSITATDDAGNGRVNVTVGIGGTEAAPSPEVIADTDTGLWGEGSNVLTIVGGGKRIASFFGDPTWVNYWQFYSQATAASPIARMAGADANIGLFLDTKGNASISLRAGDGARVLASFADAASAVNYLAIYPSATGQSLRLEAFGSDATVHIVLNAKSATGIVAMQAAGQTVFQSIGVASGVNGLQAKGSATAVAVALEAFGTDANVSISLVPKGSGLVTAPGFVVTSAAVLTAYVAGAYMELGALGSANQPFIDFHSSATNNDYDVRVMATGGTASVGQGNLAITCASISMNGAQMWPMQTAEADLAADVTIVNANTFYDGPSVSLLAGTWLIIAHVQLRDAAGPYPITAKLWDGTTVEASGEIYGGNVVENGGITLTGIVSPGSTTTYKVSAAATSGASIASIKAAAVNNGAGNNASHIRAVKIG